jgi:hypothetical protein
MRKQCWLILLLIAISAVTVMQCSAGCGPLHVHIAGTYHVQERAEKKQAEKTSSSVDGDDKWTVRFEP